MTDGNPHISDQQLLDNFYADHDNRWLGTLFQRYTLLLFGVCMKYLKNEEEARDAVQQVFLKAITELHRYPVRFFKSWLYMVGKNYCLMRLRERQGKALTEVHEDQLADEEGFPPAQSHLEKEQRLQLLEESLEALNSEQKQCVTLFYLGRKSYHEIMEITGFTAMQVKSHIQNGKRNLRLLMERKAKNDHRS